MFELLDVKWGNTTLGTPSGVVTWSSDLAGELSLNLGATDASIEEELQRAFQTWEDVAAIDFEQVASGGDVVVQAAVLDPRFAGQAGPFPTNFPGIFEMSSATIEFNSSYVWSDNGGVGSTDFYAVALHEVGHVLGLDHPNDPTQIMNATIFVDELGDGDIRGAQAIYGVDGDDVELPPLEETSASSGGGGGGGGAGAGLLVALLAFLASLFTGGGAAVAMAAGSVASSRAGEDEDDTSDVSFTEADLAALFISEDDSAGHSHADHGCGDGMHSVMIDQFALLPSVDFTSQPNPCGCVGLCEHINDQEKPVETLDLLA